MDLVISDIHADISALDTIIELASSADFEKKYGKISRIINLGDVLERGTNPKQVLQKMSSLSESYPLVSVMGNHDEAFLYGRQVSGSTLESIGTHDSLTEQDLKFFQKNKDDTYGQQEFLDHKTGLLCVHGGPLDPKKITPKDAGMESWLYQKSWQRLSEDEEFFSYAGYHYSAESAFAESTTKLENSIILCGHQHQETALEQNKEGISDILPKPKTEKLAKFVVKKKEIPINNEHSYLIRVGLGGPEGYYGTGDAKPHFAIIQHEPKKIVLFGINQ